MSKLETRSNKTNFELTHGFGEIMIFSCTDPSSARRITLCSVTTMLGRFAGITRFTTCPTGEGLEIIGFSGVRVLVILTGVS